MTRIRNLGELQGDVLLFGGPYSNLQATEALFQRARDLGIAGANIICTGDVVAYCGNPVETLALVRGSGCAVLAGNTEISLAARAGDCGCGFEEGSACDRLARDWYGYASAAVGSDDRAWMGDLPDRITFRHRGQRWVVVHGGAGDVARFLWPVSFEDDFWHEISILQVWPVLQRAGQFEMIARRFTLPPGINRERFVAQVIDQRCRALAATRKNVLDAFGASHIGYRLAQFRPAPHARKRVLFFCKWQFSRSGIGCNNRDNGKDHRMNAV